MAVEAVSGRQGSGQKQAAVRCTLYWCARHKCVLLAATLLVLLAMLAISTLLWLVSLPQKEKHWAAALRRCLDDALSVRPGESVDNFFIEWGSSLTHNLSLAQSSDAFSSSGLMASTLTRYVRSTSLLADTLRKGTGCARARLQRCLGGEAPRELPSDAAVHWPATPTPLQPPQSPHAAPGSATDDAQVAFDGDMIEYINRTLTTRPPGDLPLITEQLRQCLGGVVTVEEGGRFGNKFLEWASAWAVARTHNLTLATPTLLQRVLHKAFKHLPTGPTIIDLLRNCSFGNGLEEEDVFSTIAFVNETDTEAAVAFAAAVANASSAASVPGPLVYRAGVVLASYIARAATELRAHVVWRKQLSAMAQSKLLNFGEQTAQKFRVPLHTVVFVGVHVRRHDYPLYLRKRYKLTVEASAPYFLRALRHLSRTLGAEAGGGDRSGPLALVVSSDDMPWVQAVLLPAFDNLTRHEAIRLASFAGGVGISWTCLQDLALLSACNHSIISYGTYGITSALLAGGHVVAFELESNYHTSKIAKILPSWSVLR